MIKSTNYGGNWIIVDTARNPFNKASEILHPDLPNSTLENSYTGFDVVSNGIVLKPDTNGNQNYNNHEYVYGAWASSPFKYSNAQ